MKISNFKFQRLEGKSCSEWKAFATVDVKRFLRDKVPVEVCREYMGTWFFVETGQFTPSYRVETLVRSWEAKNGDIFSRERCK
jgi:hypothetical protein